MKLFIMQSARVPLFVCSSWAQISSSKPYSQTPSAYVSPSTRQARLHAYVQKQANL